jgi:transcriptional regulator with XRE-family HTH domain
VSIGSELTAARERAGMTVEQLSAATRIRPGLLTAMEADDFARCGGNFYARGHIRAIARVVNADPGPLLASFDATQATPEVDRSRREERTGAMKPALHPARPRWAVVLGAILVALMGWGMVRLFTLPSDGEGTAARSGPTASVTTPIVKPTVKRTVAKPPPVKPVSNRLKLTLTAAGDGSYVTLRNYHGLKLFQGLLGPNSSQTITYPGSIRVTLGVPSNIGVFVNDERVYPKQGQFMITAAGAINKLQ